MDSFETIIVGAGPAGLACAGALRTKGREALVVERASDVGSSWRRHYDRLHLHTHRRFSGLPGLAMPASDPAYPSRNDVVAYLDTYALHHGIQPRFDVEISRISGGDRWRVETSGGPLSAQNVIVASGLANRPHHPENFGQFAGTLLHSREYKTAAPFAGTRVLVVGFGNSGGEIALDLAESGVDVTVSVRGPVNIVPRDLLGLPIQVWAILQRRLPPQLVDAINAPVLRMRMGDLARMGLAKPAKGPMAQVAKDCRIPLIDIGTIDRIARGKIAVKTGVRICEKSDVAFADGSRASFDAIVLATGYRTGLASLLPDHRDVLDAEGVPRTSGARTPHEGLFFCGFTPVASGQLREIGREATKIAAAIASDVTGHASRGGATAAAKVAASARG